MISPVVWLVFGGLLVVDGFFPVAAASDAALQSLAAEVAALRDQVEALNARLTGAPAGLTNQEPAAGEDPSG